MNQKQNFLQLPFEFDINKLVKDLSLVNSDEWIFHPNVQAYSGLWEISSLCSVSGDIKDIVAVENQEYIATKLLERSSYINTILNTFQTKIEAVRFMKLGANSIIKEHCDKGSCFEEGYARLHIPITSNDDVRFILSGENYKMKLGRCYYIDANNFHSVINNGNEDRVHLLIDCHVNEWLEKIFKKAGFEKTIYKYGDKTITDDNVDDIILSFLSMNTEISLEMAKELQEKKDKNVS